MPLTAWRSAAVSTAALAGLPPLGCLPVRPRLAAGAPSTAAEAVTTLKPANASAQACASITTMVGRPAQRWWRKP